MNATVYKSCDTVLFVLTWFVFVTFRSRPLPAEDEEDDEWICLTVGSICCVHTGLVSF